MTRSIPRCRRATAALAVAVCATVMVGTGCTRDDQSADRRASRRAAAPQFDSPSVRTAAHRPTAIPAESAAAAAADAPQQQPATTVVVPAPSRATLTPIGSAREWAIAANSSSYHDSSPGQWTMRARPFVTRREARAEAAQRTGGGGVTWAQIQNERCATGVHDLVVFIPTDAPSGPAVHMVYVSARIELTCATGTDYLSTFAAQLTVQRVASRWLVALVRH